MHSKFPDNEEDAFVGNYDINEDDVKSTRMFLTTKRLIQSCERLTENLYVDSESIILCKGSFFFSSFYFNQHFTKFFSVYKDYAVSKIGSFDRNGEFNLFGLGIFKGDESKSIEFMFESLKNSAKAASKIDYQPTTIISNGDDRICVASNTTFGSIDKSIVLFSEMIKKVDEKLM